MAGVVNNANSSIYYRLLTLYKNLGLRFKAKLNTTLNEKLDILPNISIGDEYPTIKYIGIGNGGSNVMYDILKSSEHSVKDASLFSQIPFLILEKNRDLTVAERKDFRFRKEVVINGIEYVEYYLKVINNISEPEVYTVTKTGELTTSLTPFNFNDPSILNPAPLIKEDFLNVNIDTYIAVTADITLYLTPKELKDIQTAIEIKFGADASKIISEIAIFSGVDYVTTNGTEALVVQPAFYQTVQYDLESILFSESVILKNIQIGGIEVLK